MNGFKTCKSCGIAYPLKVSWDISLCWMCGLIIWRGIFLMGWRGRLAYFFHKLAINLIKTKEDAKYA